MIDLKGWLFEEEFTCNFASSETQLAEPIWNRCSSVLMWIAPLFIKEEKEKSVKEGMEMAVIWFCWPCFNAVFSDTEYNSEQAWGGISTGPCEHCLCHPRQVRFSQWVWSQRAAQKLVRGGIQLLSGLPCAADCWTWVFAVIQYCKILLSSIFPLYNFKIIYCISDNAASST